MLPTFYQAVVQSVLLYCFLCYHSSLSAENMNKLERVVKQAAKSIHITPLRSFHCQYLTKKTRVSRLRHAQEGQCLSHWCVGTRHFLRESPGRCTPSRKQRRQRRSASYSYQCGRRYSSVTSGSTSDPEQHYRSFLKGT